MTTHYPSLISAAAEELVVARNASLTKEQTTLTKCSINETISIKQQEEWYRNIIQMVQMHRNIPEHKKKEIDHLFNYVQQKGYPHKCQPPRRQSI